MFNLNKETLNVCHKATFLLTNEELKAFSATLSFASHSVIKPLLNPINTWQNQRVSKQHQEHWPQLYTINKYHNICNLVTALILNVTCPINLRLWQSCNYLTGMNIYIYIRCLRLNNLMMMVRSFEEQSAQCTNSVALTSLQMRQNRFSHVIQILLYR